MSGGHGHADPSNKKIALLISVMALFLAISETLGKGAQTSALSYNVEASNLWSFFQAKTIRQTSLRTAGELASLDAASPTRGEGAARQLDTWKATIARWESEPETQEGRKELAARAKQSEDKRDLAMARYHQYEFGSAAFQIGIVLASAAVITSVALLAWVAGALGLVGVGFTALGLFAPNLVHIF
ncbi:MAG: hypothetical protein JWN93_2403 [Hyphomicrobiales bacterium]|nr:hypothetical protein [Hyphomicrobiales bacterium]